MSIAMAANPGIKAILLRQASLLDEPSLEMIQRIATEHDFHVIAEIVGDDIDGAFVIFDGGVIREPGA